MTNFIKKSVLAAALAATALAGSAPAMADGYHGGYYHGGGGGGAGPAVAAGIFGLALGAIIASSVHHDHAYNQGGYYPAPYVQQNWAWHDGYYWDGDGNRYGRDGRYYGCEHRGYDHRGYDDRGYRGGDENGGYDGGRGY